MNEQAKGPAKRYDEAFKRQAVEHWLVSRKSARQIAAELGFNEQRLKVWKWQVQAADRRPSGLILEALTHCRTC